MRHYDNWDDNEEKIEIGKHLEKHGYTNVYYDWYLCFDKLTGELQMLANALTKEQVQRYKVQHPDVMICGDDYAVSFIVELDGSIHHTKPGMRQTERRGKSYAEAGLPCIILDKADLKELGVTWQEYLDAELKGL